MEAPVPIPQKPGPRKWDPKYEAIINLMLANPGMKKGEIAAKLNMTRAWLSTVINSDTFQTHLWERQEALNSEVSEGIKQKLVYAAETALDKTVERLNNEQASESFINAVRSDLLDRLPGYGKSSRVEQDVNVRVSPAEEAWLKRRKRLTGETIDAEFSEEPRDEGT